MFDIEKWGYLPIPFGRIPTRGPTRARVDWRSLITEKTSLGRRCGALTAVSVIPPYVEHVRKLPVPMIELEPEPVPEPELGRLKERKYWKSDKMKFRKKMENAEKRGDPEAEARHRKRLQTLTKEVGEWQAQEDSREERLAKQRVPEHEKQIG